MPDPRSAFHSATLSTESNAVQNVTVPHPSTASVLINVLLYDGPLLCGFNVAIKESVCSLRPLSCVLNTEDVRVAHPVLLPLHQSFVHYSCIRRCDDTIE